MTTVRRATQDDLLGIFKLCVSMHQTTRYGVYRFNPEKCIAQLQAWIDSALVLIAIQGDEVVGMMIATRRGLWFSDDAVVGEDVLYVRPDARGGRAAFLLVREFIALAKEQGVVDIRAGVTTAEDGQGANRLYEHFGMTNAGSNFILPIKGN